MPRQVIAGPVCRGRLQTWGLGNSPDAYEPDRSIGYLSPRFIPDPDSQLDEEVRPVGAAKFTAIAGAKSWRGTLAAGGVSS